MTDTWFADGFDGPEVIVLGLSAIQLGVLAIGLALAYLTYHWELLSFFRYPLTVTELGIAALLGWGSYDRRKLIDLAWLWLCYMLNPRQGKFTLSTKTNSQYSLSTLETPVQSPQSPAPELPTASRQAPAKTIPTKTAFDEDTRQAAPPWAIWLKVKRPKTEEAPARPFRPTPLSMPTSLPALSAPPPLQPPSVPILTLPSSTHPTSHPQEAGDIEIESTPLVVLPTSFDESELDLLNNQLLSNPNNSVPELELIDLPDTIEVLPAIPSPITNGNNNALPVFIGGPKRITFFSLNGGSGRSMLATELACILAKYGNYRTEPTDNEHPLKVALIDLDTNSATISVRLGIPQPTIWDYLNSKHAGGNEIIPYMVRHSSGARALLGTPKPLSHEGVSLVEDQIAKIIEQLENNGFHFIIMDISAELNQLNRRVLNASHAIYVVITPTARGVQDAYRSTETLRRVGLGHKLEYVVNRANATVKLDETMGDLDGTIVSTIPYDARIEQAENEHRSYALTENGNAANAIWQFAAHVYPALSSKANQRKLPLSSLTRFWKRRAS